MIDEKNIGSSFDDFLEETEMLEACEEQALKEVLTDQIMAAMQSEGINKTEMARRMKTSRQALDRLLDPKNTSLTLHTIQRAARVLGRKFTLELH